MHNMIQCPKCKQEFTLPSDQLPDTPVHCSKCQSALPPESLIPPGVKIWETPEGTILRYRRNTLIKTFFYLSVIAVVAKLTIPPIRHWLAGDFLIIWAEIMICVIAAGMLGYLIYELFGNNQIRLSGSAITLFTGIGATGVSHRLEVYDVANIELVEPIYEKYKGRAGYLELTLHNGRRIVFFKSYDRDALHYFYLRLLQKTNLIKKRG